MEEKLEIGEQPENPVVHAVATENDGTKDFEGSPLGKFKSSDALLDAYNELQSEFTRKCQKLSDTEKKLQEIINDFSEIKLDERVSVRLSEEKEYVLLKPFEEYKTRLVFKFKTL